MDINIGIYYCYCILHVASYGEDVYHDLTVAGMCQFGMIRAESLYGVGIYLCSSTERIGVYPYPYPAYEV